MLSFKFFFYQTQTVYIIQKFTCMMNPFSRIKICVLFPALVELCFAKSIALFGKFGNTPTISIY